MTIVYWFIISVLVVLMGAMTWAYICLTLDHQKLIQDYKNLHDEWRAAVEANMRAYMSSNGKLWLAEISEPELHG